MIISPAMKVIAPAISQNCEPLMTLPGRMPAPCNSHTKPNSAMIAPNIEKVRRFIPIRDIVELNGLLRINQSYYCIVVLVARLN